MKTVTGTVTAVVRRRVRPEMKAQFEQAMEHFIHYALSFPGNRGIAVLRPSHESALDYVVFDQFADEQARRAFTASPQYLAWMERLSKLTEGNPLIQEHEGVAGWFPRPAETAATARPPKWKMAGVTFLGVYPLTSSLPAIFGYWLTPWPPLLVNVFATGAIVILLTWVVMPLMTRIFAAWIFTDPQH
jgi:antibiotic biosynthesis monooxygenase (ABM) superfamily enzyme